MEKTKKKNVKRAITWICLAALVAFLAVMPLLAKGDEETDGPKASILSGAVATGDISTVLYGGGTLSEEETVEIELPSQVKLTEFLVANGDVVTQGTPVAKADRVTLMSAIASVQESLNEIKLSLMEEIDKGEANEVVAPAGGRVKLVYAQPGDDVQDVMLNYGALAVLSLDGLMAVDITTQTPVLAGAPVAVTFGDGTQVTGRVDSVLGNAATVTIEDEGWTDGAFVSVESAEGTSLGAGTLYIHNAWRAVAYSGTVKSVRYDPEDTVSAGKVLVTIENAGPGPGLQALNAQHQEYEAMMLELFELYQDDTITAPCDGVVSGVDDNSPLLLSAERKGMNLTLLANAPNGNDDIGYVNFVGMVAGLVEGRWALVMNPTELSVPDYKDLSSVPLDTALMTSVASYVPIAPIYELVEGQWQQIDAASIAVGDKLLFAGTGSADYVWLVRVEKAGTDTEQPGDGTEPDDPSQPVDPSVPIDPSIPVIPPYIPSLPSIPGGWGGMGGFSGGWDAEEQEPELYSLEKITIAKITPQDYMTLTISLDERDVGRVTLGQQADVVVEAIKNRSFAAKITDISTTGTNNGGSSKFAVELTMDRDANMLAGMNASVSITLSVTEGVLTIPVAALNENGTQTIVYTGYDAENDVLTGPVAVTVGISDAQNAQLLSGLSEGAVFYYSYYDTLELSTVAESNITFGR